jgi:o-succinylbenzoate synthase
MSRGVGESSAAERIARVEVHLLKVPLVRPYRLAFGDVVAFDTLLVELTDAQGRTGFGEATVLTGYTDESIEGAWALARPLADELSGSRRDAFVRRIEGVAAASPFLATAFWTALEMMERSAALAFDAPVRVPLLALLHGGDERGMAQEFETLLQSGYRTVKFKVGIRGVNDLAQVQLAQKIVAGRARIRIDANQAYSGPEAARFLAALNPQDIELFEQPCAAGDWQAHAMAAKASRVPMMLDESIYGLTDIERAAREGTASFIKVKLTKFCSLARLTGAIQRIRQLGMQPVLGNGVACDPGCWMEACIAARHIDNAGEMNGYLKAQGSLLVHPPTVVNGDMVIDTAHTPELNRDALKRFGIGFHSAGRTCHPAHAFDKTEGDS